MMPLRHNTGVVVAALFLSIAPTVLLQFVNQHSQATAAETQAQPAQRQLSASSEEEYLTYLLDLSGNKLAQFKGQFYRFSPDGQRLLTLTDSGLGPFYLFDVSGTKLMEFEGNGVWFSPDGQSIINTSYSATYLYDATGQKLAQLPGSSGSPMFSPNGEQFVVFANNGAYLLNASGQQIAQLPGQFLNIGSGFDSTGQRFILYGLDEPPTCDLFDSTGETIARLPHECAGISPDRQRFSVSIGTLDNLSLQLYDFSGQEVAHLSAISPTFSSDGQFILTTDFYRGSSSYLYNASGEEIARLPGIHGRFSANGQRLVTVSNNIVHLYDLSGNEIAQLPGQRAVFLPGSDQVVTYLFGVNESKPLDISGGETRLFDASGQELALLRGDPPLDEVTLFGAGNPPGINEFLHGGSFSFFSADGQRLVTTDAQNSYLYSASGEQIAVLPGVFLNFSPTGQHLITLSADHVHIFDRSGAELMEVVGAFASFSPDGQRLAITVQNTLP